MSEPKRFEEGEDFKEPKRFEDPRLITPELNRRFLSNDNDDPVSEEELDQIEKFYVKLEQMINLLGRDFYLVKKEVDRRILKVHFQREQRKQKRDNAQFRHEMNESLKKV